MPCPFSIFVEPDKKAATGSAAALIAARIQLAQRDGQRFAVALSGGRTPPAIFKALMQLGSSAPDWEKLDFWWIDERCVPPQDEQSNFGSAKAILGKKMELARIERMMGESDPKQEANRYHNRLRQSGGAGCFDLALVGVGNDGHVASLFPKSAALAEREKLAIPCEKPEDRSWRISVTLPVLWGASELLVIAAGAEKGGPIARAIRAASDSDNDDQLPIALMASRARKISFVLDHDCWHEMLRFLSSCDKTMG